jgi:hypothetical protein
MDDPGRLFPRLPAELRAYDPDERIGVVGEFLAQEVVLTGATFQIRKSPKVEAECAIVTWHDATGEQTTPVVAEFSFRYGDPDEDYSKKSVKRALDIFETLRSEPLSEWLGCQRMTKTAYVFSRSASGSG